MTKDAKWETTTISQGVEYQEKDGKVRTKPFIALPDLDQAHRDGWAEAGGTKFKNNRVRNVPVNPPVYTGEKE